MAGVAKKVVVIGFDGFITTFAAQMMREGKLPYLAELAAEGVVFTNCLVPVPTLTPPNWTTIATGAWPGTHQVSGFRVHQQGDPFTQTEDGFSSTPCRAEYLWDAAARAGKRSILLKWPCAWPPTLQNGITIDGCHLHECKHVLDVPHVFSTDADDATDPIALAPADGWSSVPDHQGEALAFELRFRPILKRVVGEGRTVTDTFGDEEVVLPGLVLDPAGGGYAQVILSWTRDAADAVAVLKRRQWSDWFEVAFPQTDRRGRTRIKLIELSDDASRLVLYATNVFPDSGWTYPAEVGPELVRDVGPFLPNCAGGSTTQGWSRLLTLGDRGEETALDLQEYHNYWLADAANHLMTTQDWDLFFTQSHLQDCVNHFFLDRADPSTSPDEATSEKYLKLLERAYRIQERALALMLASVDEDTMVILVSDHGGVPHGMNVPVLDIFEQAGLVVWLDDDAQVREKEGAQTGATPTATTHLEVRHWLQRVDWSRTRAVPMGPVNVYVNTRGRDPQGIVSPGAEYEAVRDQIIDALLDWRDPATGKRGIVLALRKEDARLLGLHGPTIGDVVYATTPEAAHHGAQLPTAEYGMGSMKGFLMVQGPGIAPGREIDRTVYLTDLAPTIACALGIPVPRDSEGRVLHELFV